MALGVNEPSEIGEMMVGLMKPDIGGILKRPWTGLKLLKQGISMAPKGCQEGSASKLGLPTRMSRSCRFL